MGREFEGEFKRLFVIGGIESTDESCDMINVVLYRDIKLTPPLPFIIKEGRNHALGVPWLGQCGFDVSIAIISVQPLLSPGLLLPSITQSRIALMHARVMF